MLRYVDKHLTKRVLLCWHQVQATEEERATLWQEVWKCRKALAVEHKMLQEPPEKTNFLTTTLRRSAETDEQKTLTILLTNIS